MTDLIQVTNLLAKVPTDHLAILLGFASIALAGFAIYAILTIAKDKGSR